MGSKFAFKRTGDDDYPRHLKVLLQGPPKSGKALRNDQLVLGPELTFTPIARLQVGDQVIGSNGASTSVVGVFPQGERPMNLVRFDDGAEVIVDDDHLWTVQPKGLAERVVTTSQVAAELAAGNRRYAYVPMVSPVNASDVGLPIDPYAMGLLIGDGGLTGTSIKFHKPDPELQDYLRQTLGAPSDVWSWNDDANTMTLADGGKLRGLIHSLGLAVTSTEKFIPGIYLRSSIANRFDLLQGLLDTDGGMNGKSVCFYTSSDRLCHDVVKLVRSLGGVAHVQSKTPTYMHNGERRVGKLAYNISIRLPAELGCPFLTSGKVTAWDDGCRKRPPTRRITSVTPVEAAEATCIKVDAADGLFVTQGFVVTHNTTFITTAPNIVVASCEAGLMSIAHLDVPYVDIDSTDKLQQLELILRDDKLRAQAAQQLEMPKIETVAIDTLDAWQVMLKKEIMAENRRTAMQQADWGVMKERMSEILKRFVTLPLNVIFTVHTSTTQDDEQRMVYAPALQGGIKDEIAGYVDFSLLSFRQRETAPNGAARIAYYLKNEGDQKNPHLGNRAAGRVPEVCAPNFGELHGAVFSAVKPSDTRGSSQSKPDAAESDIVEQVVAPAQEAAPVVSQPEEVSTPAPVPEKPTGIPADNPDAAINTEGITMLTKSYIAQGLNPPANLNEWTLEKARQMARWFIAWKTDKAAGVQVNRDDLIGYLEAMDAFNGEMDNVVVGTKDAEKASEGPAVTSNDEAPTEVTPEPEQTEEGAMALLKDKAGAVEIGTPVDKEALCEECNEPVDDVDIASLARTRFRRTLCMKDYRQAVKLTAAA